MITDNLIIDFHSHILPGMDDGSRDVETSLEMLRMSGEQGVQIQVLTSHYYPWKEEIDSFCDRRDRSFSALLQKKPSTPQLICGAEVAYFRHMNHADLSKLCVGNGRTLLIEMPFESWTNSIVDDISFLSLDMEYRIVLAHVERFMHYGGNRQKLEDLSSLPIVYQINAEAFLHFRTRRIAVELIKSGYPIILGSDAHNCTSRKPNIAEGRGFIEKRFGSNCLDKMDFTASSLLEGQF